MKDAIVKGSSSLVNQIGNTDPKKLQRANDQIKGWVSHASQKLREAVTQDQNQTTHTLNSYSLQGWKQIPKSKYPKFINMKTMRNTYITGPRGGQYFMNEKGKLFRI